MPGLRWSRFPVVSLLGAGLAAQVLAGREPVRVVESCPEVLRELDRGERGGLRSRLEQCLEAHPRDARLAYEVASTLAPRGYRDEALRALESGHQLERLRAHPRFKEVVSTAFDRVHGWDGSEEQRLWGLMLVHAEVERSFAFFDRAPEVDWSAAVRAAIPEVIGAMRPISHKLRSLARFRSQESRPGHHLRPRRRQGRWHPRSDWSSFGASRASRSPGASSASRGLPRPGPRFDRAMPG